MTSAWTTASLHLPYQANVRHHPVETMLRVLCAPTYARLYVPIEPRMKVLDIGCFQTNNLVPFHDRGCECHGVEINDDMLAAAAQGAANSGVAVTLALGNNRALPYPDGFFDLLLSINTLHYETNLEDARAALEEFNRVLRPGGRAFIFSHGPQHFIRTTAEPLPESRIRIRAEGDARAGTTQVAFDGYPHLTKFCAGSFGAVEGGDAVETYTLRTLHFLWALCKKT